MTTSSPIEPQTSQQRLFAIAQEWKIPLRRRDGESLEDVAGRLTFELERSIALMLLDLQEIAALDLQQDEAAP